jgi:hypothetical protein
MKKIFKLFIVAVFPLITSCSSDYVNVIPSGSIALMAFDMALIAEQTGLDGDSKQAVLKELFKADDIKDCGIDLTEKVYAFETTDGSLGMVAKVDDETRLTEWINKLQSSGVCSQMTEKKGFRFSVLHGNFIMGYSASALLIMGPVLESGKAELQRKMIKYLKADDETGITQTKLYEKLMGLNAPITLIAQAEALPEKFVSPFTLGAPKDASPRDIIIAATVSVENGHMTINGETFSFKESVQKVLDQSAKAYRAIEGKYFSRVGVKTNYAVFMNIDGSQVIEQLYANQGIKSMLLGINTAIDMDNIIKSINGDVVISVPAYKNEKPAIQMWAYLRNNDFLRDIEYWKKSCPKGAAILCQGDQMYLYKSDVKSKDSDTFLFGVSAPEVFFGAWNCEESINASLQTDWKPLPKEVQEKIIGSKLCFLLQTEALGTMMSEDTRNLIGTLLNPLFGDIKTILYRVK